MREDRDRSVESHADVEGDALPTGEEPPPLFGSWRNLYLVVLLELVLLILLFTWFTRHFR
jgi:hypothetical protein